MSGPANRFGSWPLVATVVAALGTLLLAGCTSGSTPTDHRATRATPSPSALSSVESRLLGPSAATPPPALASATAGIHLIGIGSPTTRLTAEVVSVRVSGSTTVLTWRLRSADGTTVSASGNWASGASSAAVDTRNVALVDAVGKVRLFPYLNLGQAVFGDTDCSCSDTPRTVTSEPAYLSGTYPALSPTATTVTVSVPGFAPMPNVPVTRG